MPAKQHRLGDKQSIERAHQTPGEGKGTLCINQEQFEILCYTHSAFCDASYFLKLVKYQKEGGQGGTQQATENGIQGEHKQRTANNAVELRIMPSSTTGSSLSPSKQTNQLPLALLLLLRLQPFPPNPLFPE